MSGAGPRVQGRCQLAFLSSSSSQTVEVQQRVPVKVDRCCGDDLLLAGAGGVTERSLKHTELALERRRMAKHDAWRSGQAQQLVKTNCTHRCGVSPGCLGFPPTCANSEHSRLSRLTAALLLPVASLGTRPRQQLRPISLQDDPSQATRQA